MSRFVADDAEGTCAAAAARIGEVLRAAIDARGRASLAASGGRTPGAVWRVLRAVDLDWASVDLFQVDERVAPEGHPDRNLCSLRLAFETLPLTIHPMPIDGSDYSPTLRLIAGDVPVLDVVQLGMGADGHTASLFAEGPWPDGEFGSGGEHLGRARYTLGFACLNRARARVFVITGADKADALRGVQAGELRLPASRISRTDTWFFLDRAAAEGA